MSNAERGGEKIIVYDGKILYWSEAKIKYFD
jgi:hypothetical protein